MKQLTQKQIIDILDHHIRRGHSRSGWHGGQKVNKKETKAEGYLNISDITAFDDEQKDWIVHTYHNHISKQGVMRLTCQEQRSLHQNLEVLKKHYKIMLEMIGKESVFDALHHHGHKRHKKHKKKKSR